MTKKVFHYVLNINRVFFVYFPLRMQPTQNSLSTPGKLAIFLQSALLPCLKLYFLRFLDLMTFCLFLPVMLYKPLIPQLKLVRLSRASSCSLVPVPAGRTMSQWLDATKEHENQCEPGVNSMLRVSQKTPKTRTQMRGTSRATFSIYNSTGLIMPGTT